MKNPFNPTSVIGPLHSGLDIIALRDVKLSASSEGLDWHGLQLYIGSSHGWDGDDLMVDGHFVVINLSRAVWPIRTRNESSWISSQLPSLTFWINPEGHPFSLHHTADSNWAACTIYGKFLDTVMGRHYELNEEVSMSDQLLANLFKALIANLNDRMRSNRQTTDQLIRAFVCALATRHGRPAADLPPKCGIAPHQLKSLLAWLEGHVEGALTVDVMASQVGLSVAHFAREFKRSTGITPWEYVVSLRLDRASKLLLAGASVRAVALQTGFSDQSHLARLFRHKFGISPSAFVRSKDPAAAE